MVNKVILIGNLGKDPEMQTLDNGIKNAKFSLATSESYKNKEGEKIETTEWHNIVLWRGIAEVAEKYLNKGDKVYIEGKIKTNSWDDKEGNKKYSTQIIGDRLVMLGNKSEKTNEPDITEPKPIENKKMTYHSNYGKIQL